MIIDHILSRYRFIINILHYIVTELVIIDHILYRVIDFYRLWALSVTSDHDIESLPSLSYLIWHLLFITFSILVLFAWTKCTLCPSRLILLGPLCAHHDQLQYFP